jgi:hypothetical protein
MRPLLPAEIAKQYRVAIGNEIRAESYGELKSARINAEREWRRQRGTFDDQALFGPKRDFECACGKYSGRKCEDFVCDQCGVKVTAAAARRLRCAHMSVGAPVRHPLDDGEKKIDTVAVLPVAFIEAPNGAELLHAYDEVLRGRDEAELSRALLALIEVLAPAFVVAHKWGLAERTLLAHAIGLWER